jgi:predicted phage terminase large subunit-like protein
VETLTESLPSIEDIRREKARRHLLDFVEWATPGSLRPTHLPALTEAIEASINERQYRSFSAPPQFGKSVLILNGLVWAAWNRPGSTSAYVTYGDAAAQAQSAKAFAIAERAGLNPKGNLYEFKISNGSTLIFTSTDGPIESRGIDGLLVVDDPYKNPGEASSAADRKFVEDWFFGTALGRIHATSSIIVCHHRWTEKDLIVTLKRHGQDTGDFRWTNYPALDADGKSLWEALKPTDFLHKQKALTLTSKWEAYYQGNPRPDGGRVFGEVQTYKVLPALRGRYAIGIDQAFSSKKASDFNTLVVMLRVGTDYYVVEAQRSKESAPLFMVRLKKACAKYGTNTVRWYCGPTEIGQGQLMAREIPGFQVMPASVGKLERAQPLAAAWETRDGHVGQVFVPKEADWVDEYLEEMQDFTGTTADLHDDFVDASAAVFDALQVTVGAPGVLPTNIVSNWASPARAGGFWQRPE